MTMQFQTEEWSNGGPKRSTVIDWSKPIECWFGSNLPARVWADDGDCKWLEIGGGRFMFNNDGTQVEGWMRVRNPVDVQAQMTIEAASTAPHGNAR